MARILCLSAIFFCSESSGPTALPFMEFRRWEKREIDCLTNIFGRLGIEDLTVAVPFVCHWWYRASLNLLCRTVLDFRSLDFMPWSREFHGEILTAATFVQHDYAFCCPTKQGSHCRTWNWHLMSYIPYTTNLASFWKKYFLKCFEYHISRFTTYLLFYFLS